MQKVARKQESCSKYEKLPKNCRTTCGKPQFWYNEIYLFTKNKNNGFINNIPEPVGCIEAVAEEVADAADGLTTVVTVGNGTAWGQKWVKFCLIM